MTAGRTAGTKKPSKVSFKNWYSEFRQLTDSDPKLSGLFRYRPALYGELNEMLPFLLYIYVCGAPTGPEVSVVVKKAGGGDLAEQMEDLAGAIRRFDCGKESALVRPTLRDMAAAVDWGRIGSPDEIYARLPRWLSGLALILRGFTFDGPFFSPPVRKLIQSRALALLYFHTSGTSAYKKAVTVATLLRPAYQASGLREDVSHDAVLNRIRRFQKNHPIDFSRLKQLVESKGLSTDVHKLYAFLIWPTLRSH